VAAGGWVAGGWVAAGGSVAGVPQALSTMEATSSVAKTTYSFFM
jgi:hypothetical protein